MKRTVISILFLLFASVAPAKEIKVLMGINWNKYLFSSEITSLNRQQKSGLAIGFGYAIEINPKMQLEANVIYNKKGAKTLLEYALEKTVSGTYSNTSIALPFFFKYCLKEGSSPYAALGPEFNFILTHKLEIAGYDKELDIADNTNKFIIAFNAALGYELPLGQWGLFAEVRYNRWFSNLLKNPDVPVKSESVSFLLGGIYYL